MSRSDQIIYEGLKRLENLEKKKFCKKTKKNKKKIHDDDFSDHDDDVQSDNDDIILADDDNNIFDKKKVNITILTNFPMINKFPNALLLEQPKKEDDSPIVSESTSENNIDKNETVDDIFELIKKIKKENISESLDSLITESDDKNDESDDHPKICKGCNAKNSLIEDQQTGVIVCSDCGMVNEELLDHGPEWRQYNNDDNRGDGLNRCGCPSNFFFPKSSQGTIMVGASNSRLKRKQKWNSMVYKERSLNNVFELITRICSKNNIPKIIVDSAKILYKQLSDCKHQTGPNTGKQIIIRGENRTSIIAACIFKACEMNKSPRNVKEIADFFGLEEKKVTKGNKQFEKIIKNAESNSTIIEQFKTNTTEDFIRRFCKPPLLKVNKANTDLAVVIAKNCCKMKLASDHNPQSIAAGSILLMTEYCDLDIEKKDIAKLFGTSDVTISKIYSKISKYVKALVDDDATEYLIKKFKING